MMMQNMYRRDRYQGFGSILPRVFTHVPVLGEKGYLASLPQA
jgi:hypothetical protein